MSSPLIFFVIILVINLVLTSSKEKKKVQKKRQSDMRNTQPQVEKKKPGSTIRELRHSLENQFERQMGKSDDFDNKGIPKETQVSSRREGMENLDRKELIQKQREKINKHSVFEQDKRLKRQEIVPSSRLSDIRASKDPSRRVDYEDLETIKPVTIEVEDTAKNLNSSKQHGMINIKKDIVKGIIYSEILSKPKSMEKHIR